MSCPQRPNANADKAVTFNGYAAFVRTTHTHTTDTGAAEDFSFVRTTQVFDQVDSNTIRIHR